MIQPNRSFYTQWMLCIVANGSVRINHRVQANPLRSGAVRRAALHLSPDQRPGNARSARCTPPCAQITPQASAQLKRPDNETVLRPGHVLTAKLTGGAERESERSIESPSLLANNNVIWRDTTSPIPTQNGEKSGNALEPAFEQLSSDVQIFPQRQCKRAAAVLGTGVGMSATAPGGAAVPHQPH
ncbi:hypothetical protein AAFF_G00282100 [Aldrovandia affinis]|uniref:Uncharacterized protein n=1 Tax=Aldrovandia affinis TaxID=143900 RepID=A0AAD7R9V6_9TELE|nr:hypothetical protein AAFF_G00282100 [Aldrovandia affinis]